MQRGSFFFFVSAIVVGSSFVFAPSTLAQCEICYDPFFGTDRCEFCSPQQGDDPCFTDCNFDAQGNCYNNTEECLGGAFYFEGGEQQLLADADGVIGLYTTHAFDSGQIVAWDCRGRAVGLVVNTLDGDVRVQRFSDGIPEDVARKEAMIQALAAFQGN